MFKVYGIPNSETFKITSKFSSMPVCSSKFSIGLRAYYKLIMDFTSRTQNHFKIMLLPWDMHNIWSILFRIRIFRFKMLCLNVDLSVVEKFRANAMLILRINIKQTQQKDLQAIHIHMCKLMD